MTINLSKALKIAGLVCLAAAFCVAESWLTAGLFAEWLSAGLALWLASETL